MSPESAFPARAAAVAWRDVAAVTVVMLTAFALILPAIYSSRFHARLATCQNNLRRFGLALAEYSDDHGEALPQLASAGRLTGEGLFAAGLIENTFAADGGRPLCPDAWLAAQSALRRPCHDGDSAQIVRGHTFVYPSSLSAIQGNRLVRQVA